jgi:hypothetical protein
MPGLGGNQQRYHSGIIISPRRLTMPISWTTASQVDDAVSSQPMRHALTHLTQ